MKIGYCVKMMDVDYQKKAMRNYFCFVKNITQSCPIAKAIGKRSKNNVLELYKRLKDIQINFWCNIRSSSQINIQKEQ